MYDVPEIPDYPSKSIPIASLNMKLANPTGYNMDFRIEVPVTTKVLYIQDKINERHGGGVRDVSISFHKYRPEDPAPLTSSLIELGIYQPGEVNVYYDYVPVSYPLLN